MNRYLSSFIIAFILYTGAMATIFYFINQKSNCHAKCTCEKMHKINIAMVSPLQTDVTQVKKEKKVEPKPKPKPKPIEKPKPKPVHKPKPKPKPVEKPKPKPIVKEEPKTIPVKKEKIQPEPEPEQQTIVQEETTEELYEREDTAQNVEEEQVEQLATQEQTQESSVAQAQEAQILQAKQNLFLTNLIERINNNKSYPNMARRRCIEGEVDVKFVVMADGTVEKIEIISGRKIFKKSTIQAISRSFPMEVDTSLFSFPKEFKIKISYILR